MTSTQIRQEIIELINSGIMDISKIVSYFKQNHKEASIDIIKEEAKDLVNEAKQIIKRGY
jgi:glycerol-3-phosphate responsive antiterminator